MKRISNILKLFRLNFEESTITEKIDLFECIIEANDIDVPEKDAFINLLNQISNRDSFTVSIRFGESDPVAYERGRSSFVEFSEALKSKKSIFDEGRVKISVSSYKKQHDGIITIYSLQHFAESIASLELEKLLKTFSNQFDNSCIIFNCQELSASSRTKSIFFTSSQQRQSDLEAMRVYRKKRIESISTSVHYSHATECPLIPEDFIFQSELNIPDLLAETFRKASYALFIISIYDITTLSKNEVIYRLNGYKSINGHIDFSTLPISSYEEYSKIYDWIYSSGSLVDKLGLARNIISIHLVEKAQVELKENAFQSVCSSYKIYEKQNIRQYIAVRNKISDQLLDFNKRASMIVDSFATGFRQSSMAVITFFSSIMVFRILSTGDFTNVFTFDATVLALIFVIGSFLYLAVSWWEVGQQRERFEASYFNLKERYTDLLLAGDIDRILNNDKEFHENIQFIKKKTSYYCWLWICISMLILGAVLLLHLKYVMIHVITKLFG